LNQKLIFVFKTKSKMGILEETYQKLLDGNKVWVEERLKTEPNYFAELSKGQSPHYLWIGCSDSRSPESEITGAKPGEIFVHRNIANMVVGSDINMLSVLQYAVEVLHVKHIIVCGHYGCGGVIAAMQKVDKGLVNNWLNHIKDVYHTHKIELDKISDAQLKTDRLVELNVACQVENLAKTSIVQKAWRNRELQIHGWVFDLRTGKIKDLEVMKDELSDFDDIFHFEETH
jgi:carbonic anhydrase